MGTESNGKRRLTRRRVLKAGATALGGGTALLAGTPAVGAQNAQAPAVLTNTQTGRTFRGLVRHDSTLDVQQMRLLPTDPRQVVIRSTAVAPCYTIVRGALSTNPIRRAEVPNHCGFGVVEAVGAMVKRVQVGDRVLVAGTSQCGQCYQCLHGRPDYCQFTFFSNAPGVEAFPPFAQMLDGTPVYAQAGIGGMSEIMTAFEEYCVPLFTDLPAAQLTLLGDQLASGFAAGHADMRFEPGSDVVVFGAGPVGLYAAKSAWLMGAGRVIVVDHLEYRLEKARTFANAEVVNFGEYDDIVAEMKKTTDSLGADVAIDAVGAEADGNLLQHMSTAKFKLQGGSPIALNWAIDSVRKGGTVSVVGAYGPMFSAVKFGDAMNKGLTIHTNQCPVKRQWPRLWSHIHDGYLKPSDIVTHRIPLDDIAEGYHIFSSKLDDIIKPVVLVDQN